MSLYTTPLQLGYFFGLIIWIVLLVRGLREDRLSDKLLAWVLFLLAMEVQDYTFGFAGINVLWNELNGFPRAVHLLIGPIVYFYFKAQINREFRLRKSHLIHFLPYSLYCIYQLIFFVQGAEVVEYKESAIWDDYMGYLYLAMCYTSYTYYFSKCLRIYSAYRKWSVNQFSNIELIDFKWFRNFILALIFYLSFRAIMNILDAQFDWPFYQDWWWNLGLVMVIFYIGLAGIMQKQPAKIYFSMDDETQIDEGKTIPADEMEQSELAKQLDEIMKSERLFLQAELNLRELSQHLNTNTSLLSKAINQSFKMNFNDYVNSLRIEAFIKAYQEDQEKNYTMIALAFDAGFNSVSTFNRAFKKIKGNSPKEYFKN